jgi:hypothetical protein
MDKREALTWQIWRMDGMGRALLVGGLLGYIPLINLVLVAYYAVWARRLIRREGVGLPEWTDGRGLLEEGVRVLPSFLVWVFLPMVLAGLATAGVMSLFHLLFLGFLAPTLGALPLMVVAVLAPPAFVLSLIRLHDSGSVSRALDLAGIFRTVIRQLRECLFPLLQFYGILVIGWPLAGFAAFLATLPLIAQMVLVLREAEDGHA